MRIQVVHSQAVHIAGRARRSRRLLLAVAAATLAPLVVVPAANAADSGTNSSTVEITPSLVRSITVSPTNSSFGNCLDVTGPNAMHVPSLNVGAGSCRLGTVNQEDYVTVTNGPVAGQIKVNGADALPAVGTGPGWAIGPGRAADQFGESNYNKANGQGGVYLSTDPLCDPGFNGSPTASDCAAPANAASDESLQIDAPSSSTITASTLSITTTWTAVP